MARIESDMLVAPKVFQPLRDEMDLTTQKAKVLSEALLDVLKAQEKIGDSAKNSAKGLKELATAEQKSKKAANEKLKVDQQIAKAGRINTQVQKKQRQTLAELRVENQRRNKVAKQEALINNKNIGIYDRQSAVLVKLRAQYKNVALAEGETSAKALQLQKRITALDGRLKRVDRSAGQFGRNVGNYPKMFSRVGAAVKSFGLTMLAAFSFRAIGSFFKSSIAGFQQQEKAVAKVEQAIKSTGGAAGRTGEQLKKMASDLQSNTLFGDEQILNEVTAQLLTFTNISGDQFDRTQAVALDLATVLDGDLKSASIQLGKALNDPVANLSALSRSGIQFSTEQKALIKTLTETGRLAEAQGVILTELERQYGGQAAAAADADGGITQLKNTFGDLKEIIGGELLKVIKPIAKDLKQFIEDLDPDDVKAFAASVGSAIKAFANWGKELFLLIGSFSKATKSGEGFIELIVRLTKFANPFKFMKAGLDFILEKLGLADDLTRAWKDALDLLDLREWAADLGLVEAELESLSEAQKKNNSVREKSIEITNELLAANEDEIQDIPILIDALQNENTTREDKAKIIAKLQKDYPELIKNIDLETASTEQLVQVKKELMKTLFNQAIAEKKALVTAELRGQILDLELKKIGKTAIQIERIQKKQDELVLGFKRIDEVERELTANLSEFVDNMNLESPIDDTADSINRLKNEIAGLQKELSTVDEETDKARFDDLTDRINQKINELAQFDADYAALIRDGLDEELNANDESVKDLKKTGKEKLRTQEQINKDLFADLQKQNALNRKIVEADLLAQGKKESEVNKKIREERIEDMEQELAFAIEIFGEFSEQAINLRLTLQKELRKALKEEKEITGKTQKELDKQQFDDFLKQNRENALILENELIKQGKNRQEIQEELAKQRLEQLQKERDLALKKFGENSEAFLKADLELNRALLKQSEDAAKKMEEVFNQLRKGLTEVTNFIAKSIEKNIELMDAAIAKKEEEIDASKDREKELEDIAKERGLNAEESINAERELQKKLLKDQQDLERKKQRAEALIAALRAFAAQVESGQGNPVTNIQNSITKLKSFIDGAFYEGTDFTVADAIGRAPLNSTRDGYLARLDGHEAVLNSKQTQELGIRPGGNSTDDVVKMFKASVKRTHDAANSAVLVPGVSADGGLGGKIDQLISITKKQNSNPGRGWFDATIGALRYKDQGSFNTYTYPVTKKKF